MADSTSEGSGFRSQASLTAVQEGMILEIQAPNYPPRKVYIKSPRCSVGSAPECTLRLVAPGVEPVHCLIMRANRQVRVERVAASTWLNQREFQRASLRPGDRLQVGPIQICLLSVGQELPVSASTSIEASPVSARMASGLKRFPPHFGEEITKQKEGSGEGSTTYVGENPQLREQTTRHLGHQRAKRLIAMLRQARQQIHSLHSQLEHLRQDLDSLRTQQVSWRSLSEEAAELQKRSHQLAEWENRLTRQQSELEAQKVQLEAHRQSLQRQWTQWQAEHAKFQQDLQHQFQTLQEEHAHLRQAQQSLQAQLQELQAQQEALRDQQRQQEQTLQAQQEQLAQKERELHEWEHRLELQSQALAEREDALAEQHQSLQQQRQLLAEQQQQWQAQKTPQDSEVPEARVSEERLQRHTRAPEPRSGTSAEEILRRLGMMPNLGEEDQQESTSGKELLQVSAQSHASPNDPAPSASPEHQEELIQAYMERLLGRSRKEDASSGSKPPPQDGTARGRRIVRNGQADTLPEGKANQPERSPGRPSPEWVPRGVAPERGVDLEAMRELANLSAHSALAQHRRRKTLAAVWAKFAATLFSLLIGCGMLWLWAGDPERDLALYAAGVCFAGAALWGLQYLLLAGKLIWHTLGLRRPAPDSSPVVLQEDSPMALPTEGAAETTSSEHAVPPVKGN